jgi:hypothetical protein
VLEETEVVAFVVVEAVGRHLSATTGRGQGGGEGTSPEGRGV